MSERISLSLIIVNWNVRDLLRTNLARLFSVPTTHAYEVIVVDNGSQDGSVKMIQEEFPQVHLIRNEVNRGFAFACNQGLRVSRGEVILLLNPDMEVRERVLDHVYTTLQTQKDIGVMGVMLRRQGGSVIDSVRRDPGLKDQLAILLKLPHLFPRVIDRYLAKGMDYTVSQNVEQLRGSLFAFRRQLIDKIGTFDAKRFFIWFEEVDFCKRVRQAGYRVWYSADVFCVDLIGRSFAQRSTCWKQAQLSKSMANYFFKWHHPWRGMLIMCLRPVVICVGWLADRLHTTSRLWK